MSRDKNQLEFDFIAGDKACRTCTYLVSDVGVDWRGREGRHYACTLGGFKMSTKVVNFKDECNSFKWGGEKMPFVDFRKMSEEQLRGELNKIRDERRGVGKKKRVEHRERRQAGERKERKSQDIVRL